MEVRTFSIPQADRRTATGKTPDRGPCLAKHFQYPSSGSTDCNPGLVARGSGEERDFQYPSSGSTDCNVLERLLTPGGRAPFSIPQADRRTATGRWYPAARSRSAALSVSLKRIDGLQLWREHRGWSGRGTPFSIPQADRRTATHE